MSVLIEFFLNYAILPHLAGNSKRNIYVDMGFFVVVFFFFLWQPSQTVPYLFIFVTSVTVPNLRSAHKHFDREPLVLLFWIWVTLGFPWRQPSGHHTQTMVGMVMPRQRPWFTLLRYLKLKFTIWFLPLLKYQATYFFNTHRKQPALPIDLIGAFKCWCKVITSMWEMSDCNVTLYFN